MGSTLERHPFSRLIHSAGELLHRGGRGRGRGHPVPCAISAAEMDSTISKSPPAGGDSSCLVCRPPRAPREGPRWLVIRRRDGSRRALPRFWNDRGAGRSSGRLLRATLEANFYEEHVTWAGGPCAPAHSLAVSDFHGHRPAV